MLLSELDIPELQEWFNCSAAQKKTKEKTPHKINSVWLSTTEIRGWEAWQNIEKEKQNMSSNQLCPWD